MPSSMNMALAPLAVLPVMRASGAPLACLRRVEVGRVEPGLERAFRCRPFPVDDRVPGRVAVAALVDGGLAEDALEAEAQPLRRRARGRVEGVAFPLVAPVAELVEHPPHHQVHGLGGRRRALQERRVRDVADLDHADPGLDPQVRGNADRLAGRLIDDGVEQRILALAPRSAQAR